MRISFRGMRGEVVAASGPWRTSGDWWQEDPWQQDEWDLEIHFRFPPAIHLERTLYVPAARPLPHLLRLASRQLVCAGNLRLTMTTSNFTRAPLSVFSKALPCPRNWPACARNTKCQPWRCSIATAFTARRAFIWPQKNLIRAHIGAEVTSADGWRYPLLVESRAGYQNLCRLITRMKLRARKGEGCVSAEEIAEQAAA